MKKVFCAIFSLALMLVCAPRGWSQAQITTATVEGDVLDERGGSIPDASVEIRNLDTNFSRTITTNSDGHFTFLNLAPGRYTITVTKSGFATIVQQNIDLTVGQVLSLPITQKVSAASEQIVVTDVPIIEVTKTEDSSTLTELAVASVPVLGRKFEDLLTLTPGVSISQGPDGDEININGQRGIFNNISLDGGDYNNGFFGEQPGGQRAAADITLEAVKEFQIISSGANAEYGRTAGGVVNVITKSGTNDYHGSLFEYFRTEALTATTSDGKPLDNFRRNQFGGSFGGHLIKDKLFFFTAGEGIRENLTRKNLSVPLGTACSVPNPVFNNGSITDAAIAASPDCQRLVLLNFFKTNYSSDESKPVNHQVRNAALFGRVDYNLNASNQIFGSYNFDWSKNPNQTFDVPTYGTSANGTEGPSKIQAVNLNWFSTLSSSTLNEAHFTYGRETRPRSAANTAAGAIPDTAMGFGTTFRFGQPFFLEPTVDELFYRTGIRDNLSLIKGKHTFKVGGEWLHSRNTQIFRGFFTGRYIFDSVTGFLHYASPSTLGPGFGPGTVECAGGTFSDIALLFPDANPKNPSHCGSPAGPSLVGGPLLLYLQHGPTGLPGSTTLDQSGYANIANDDFSLFVQDTWKVTRNFTLNYGLRWDAQHFPNPVIAPANTAYGSNLTDPNFPSTGKLPNQNKEFQPRLGFAWDITGKGTSALRASVGIFNARQNMLTQTGPITTNGVQQQEIAAGTFFNTANAFAAPPPPTYPGVVPTPPLRCGGGKLPCTPGVTVFDKSYANPRIYAFDVGYEQKIIGDLAGYVDFTWSKGVHLTRFTNPNVSRATGAAAAATCAKANLVLDPTGVCIPATGGAQTVTYLSSIQNPDFSTDFPAPFSNLGSITDTVSSAKSLYRGLTIGARKRFSHRFLFDANYVYSVDRDDDSNERDPFSFRYANLFNLASEYSYSDRDERHKFNFYTVADLPWGIQANIRMQAHSAQPMSVLNRIQDGVTIRRNTLRKDNAFFTFDFGVERPFHLGERLRIIPKIEVFNTFNNKNNVNPLSSPQLFDFNGFLRVGVGDPRQAQLAIRLEF
ncbi:MAG TPA: carboxypeptidase regulatory-like domain-containing protein [Candidatus Eremiobacteraceae bacterium]|nr:carboxypeptidase regulatory-like domain-containing protein [Candidatus Eremiobacteraceae bacterium]